MKLVRMGHTILFLFGLLWLTGQLNQAEAGSAVLTVQVNLTGSGTNVDLAQVAVQQCSTEGSGCTTWGKIVKLGTTNASGQYAPSLTTDYRYRVVVTKDYHVCGTPSNCTRTFFFGGATTKSFTLTDELPAGTNFCPARYNVTTTESNWLGERRKVAERAEDPSTSSYWNLPGQNRIQTELGGYFHSWFDNNPNFSTAARSSRWIFKTSQVTTTIGGYAWDSSEALQKVQDTAINNPGYWWILGEEPNARSTDPKNGDKAMTVQEYARFIYLYTSRILGVDQSAKIVGIYLAHEWTDPNKPLVGYTSPFTYYIGVYNEWRNNSTYKSFCPEPPIDAIHVNYTPWQEVWKTNPPNYNQYTNPALTIDYVNKWRDFIMSNGTSEVAGANLQGTLVNELFSLGTYDTCDPGSNPNCPPQGKAGHYWQGVYGTLVNNRDYPWVGLVMNFATYPMAGESVIPTHLYTDPTVTQQRDEYFPIFANILNGNAGFEQGIGPDPKETGNTGGTPYQYSQYCYDAQEHFSTTTGGPSGTNGTKVVSSSYAVRYNATYTPPYEVSCYLDSRKYYADGSNASSVKVSFDYRRVSGSQTLLYTTLTITFYDEAGNALGDKDCDVPVGQPTSGLWHNQTCDLFPSYLANVRFIDASLLAGVNDAGTYDYRFDNLTVQFVP